MEYSTFSNSIYYHHPLFPLSIFTIKDILTLTGEIVSSNSLTVDITSISSGSVPVKFSSNSDSDKWIYILRASRSDGKVMVTMTRQPESK